MRGSSQRAANDGITLTRNWRGLLCSVISRTASAMLGERGANAAREPLALVGQTDAATGALDQAHAEVVLQRLELVADRAMRDVHRFGRLGEAARARDGFERAQRLRRGYPGVIDPHGCYVRIFRHISANINRLSAAVQLLYFSTRSADDRRAKMAAELTFSTSDTSPDPPGPRRRAQGGRRAAAPVSPPAVRVAHDRRTAPCAGCAIHAPAGCDRLRLRGSLGRIVWAVVTALHARVDADIAAALLPETMFVGSIDVPRAACRT